MEHPRPDFPANDGNIESTSSSSSSAHPPPISPYRPSPRFDLTEIVTPSTIIPACYFTISSVAWSSHEQTYLYTIHSLPWIGDHHQPNLTRTVFEDVLESQTNIRKRNELLDMEGKVWPETFRNDNDETVDGLRDVSNRMKINTSAEIEVGDIVDVRVTSSGIDEFFVKMCPERALSGEIWFSGIVVGTNTQHGLWECFLVSIPIDKYGHRTLPCTERLLKLVQKGTHSAKKQRSGNVYRVGGPGGGRTRTMRPVLLRRETGTQGVDEEKVDLKIHRIGANGICFGDAGKLG